MGGTSAFCVHDRIKFRCRLCQAIKRELDENEDEHIAGTKSKRKLVDVKSDNELTSFRDLVVKEEKPTMNLRKRKSRDLGGQVEQELIIAETQQIKAEAEPNMDEIEMLMNTENQGYVLIFVLLFRGSIQVVKKKRRIMDSLWDEEDVIPARPSGV